MSDRGKIRKSTRAQTAYVRSMRKKSAFQLLDEGEAEVLDVAQYPEPLQRFLLRERRTVRVELSAAVKHRLEETSRALGVRPERLARKWIEEKLRRNTG